MSTRAASAADARRVGVTLEGPRAPVSASRLAAAVRDVLRAEGVRAAMISVTLVPERTIARLNRRHLAHRGPTDVIAFGFSPSPGAPVVGDIYICPEVARRNARSAGCGVREELLRLAVHGTLHVLGWEHPADAGREESPMWRRQERLLAAVRRREARRT